MLLSTSDVHDRTHIRAVPRRWNNDRSAWLASVQFTEVSAEFLLSRGSVARAPSRATS
jgi:hypothetical protein